VGAPRSALPLLDSPRTLWILLASALLVRLWGIGYGLPYVYWIDEYHEVMRALELGTGHFNFERTGKGGFYLLLFFEFGLYFLVLKAAGFVSSVQQFAEQFVRDPTPFYLMGRATAAAFGCATVAAAYWVGRRAYGAHAGLVGAAFLAFNVLHVDLSHRVGVDVPMTMLATLTIVFALQIVERGELRDYALAAFCAALATTTKLPGLLLLLPLLIAHMYRMGRSGEPWTAWITSRRMWIAFLLFCAVLIATNPAVVLHFDPLAFYSSDHNDALEAGEIPGDSPGADSRPNLHGYYLNVLLQSMGWPLFGLSLIAVGRHHLAVLRYRHLRRDYEHDVRGPLLSPLRAADHRRAGDTRRSDVLPIPRTRPALACGGDGVGNRDHPGIPVEPVGQGVVFAHADRYEDASQGVVRRTRAARQ
jgi:4-amino-4-deoxy-L-arabinose transferase-like glycosyltransferase